MSSLANPAAPVRTRAPRTVVSGIERARLALVPVRRSRAPRAPFAVLVFLILGAGVVGLLMFNTHMQQASFYATSLQNRADALAAKRQGLEMEVAQLRNPQQVALRAKRLGMVAPPNPAMLNLATGRIEGDAVAALPDDKVSVTLPAAHLPSILNPRRIVIRVPGVTAATTPPTGTAAGTATTRTTGRTTGNSGHSQAHHGPASP